MPCRFSEHGRDGGLIRILPLITSRLAGLVKVGILILSFEPPQSVMSHAFPTASLHTTVVIDSRIGIRLQQSDENSTEQSTEYGDAYLALFKQRRSRSFLCLVTWGKYAASSELQV